MSGPVAAFAPIATNAGADLLEVQAGWAGGDRQDEQKQAAPPVRVARGVLDEVRLLTARSLGLPGENALQAAKVIDLPVPRWQFWAEYQRRGLIEWRPVNATQHPGLTNADTRSAELALAVCYLAFQAGVQPQRTIFATGLLATDRADKLPRDVPVGAVGHLEAKLAAILHRLASTREAAILFLPVETLDGQPVEHQHAASLRALRALGVEVVPVASLRQAITHLGCRHLRVSRRDRWLMGGVAAGLLLAVAATGWNFYQSRPQPVHFAHLTVEDGTQRKAPLRVELDPAGQRDATGRRLPRVLPDCVLAEFHDLPGHQVGELMLIAGQSPPGLFGARYVLPVAVGEKSGMDEVLPPMPINDLGQTGMVEVPIVSPAEPARLFLLASRMFPDTAQIQTGLTAALAGVAEGNRLGVAKDYLQTHYAREKDSLAIYDYAVVEAGTCG